MAFIQSRRVEATKLFIISLKRFCVIASFLFFLTSFFFFFSAGVGRAGTFCVVYSAIRELHGTRNIGEKFLVEVKLVSMLGQTGSTG